MNSSTEHAAGLDAARKYAAWHIGDPSWADLIIGTYLNPAVALHKLQEEKEDNS